MVFQEDYISLLLLAPISGHCIAIALLHLLIQHFLPPEQTTTCSISGQTYMYCISKPESQTTCMHPFPTGYSPFSRACTCIYMYMYSMLYRVCMCVLCMYTDLGRHSPCSRWGKSSFNFILCFPTAGREK